MIDRYKLVNRHNPVLTAVETDAPLTVGNGNFAFTADVTGMQTLYGVYEKSVPLCTMAQWGWHTEQASAERFGYRLSDVETTEYPYRGRTVRYAVECKTGNEEAYHWVRRNPHKFNLGRIGLCCGGRELAQAALGDIRQELKLYEGLLESCFSLATGQNGGEQRASVRVRTAVDGRTDTVAFQIESELLRASGLAVSLQFPYASPEISGSDWEREDAHTTELVRADGAQPVSRVLLKRTLDRDTYYVALTLENGVFERCGVHSFVVRAAEGSARLALSAHFVPGERAQVEVCEESAEQVKTGQQRGRFVGKKACADIMEQAQSERQGRSAEDKMRADTCSESAELEQNEVLRRQRARGKRRMEAVDAEQVFAHSRACWKRFWEKGGAVDLHRSSDPRAFELERRIVLSQYLLAVQSAGDVPPQETGLTCNSWYGKAHLEMYLWHEAWLPLWNHTELLSRSLEWYLKRLPEAEENAARNGFAGARWPKMVSDEGVDCPSPIATLLIWQQPHIIYMLELAYRNLLAEKDGKNGAENSVETDAADGIRGQKDGCAAKKGGKNDAENSVEADAADGIRGQKDGCAAAKTGSAAVQTADAVAFLKKYLPLIEKTAEFMVDFAVWNEARGVYELLAPLIPVQENHAPMDTRNPAFELEYWKFTLEIAAEWERRLGRAVPDKWLHTAAHMAPVAVKDGLYLAHDNCPDSYGAFAHDHPSMLCAYGLIDSGRTDRAVMENSLRKVEACWDYPSLWGWDFAVMAMTATRLGRPEFALDLLLMDSPKNRYVSSGNNFQEGRQDLPLYLPGNGSLMLAVALMTAGWPGSGALPGFPKNGQWTVEYEGIDAYPY